MSCSASNLHCHQSDLTDRYEIDIYLLIFFLARKPISIFPKCQTIPSTQANFAILVYALARTSTVCITSL